MDEAPRTPRVRQFVNEERLIHIAGCDDEPAAHDWILELTPAKRRAIQYTACASVAELIRLLNSDVTVDVVILDLNLGTTNGVETFDALRADVQNLPPVIIRSGESESKMRPLLVGQNKAFHFLAKGDASAAVILSLCRDLMANEHRFYRYVAPPPEEREARQKIDTAKRALDSMPPPKPEEAGDRAIQEALLASMQMLGVQGERFESSLRDVHANTAENTGHLLRIESKVDSNTREIARVEKRAERNAQDIAMLDDQVEDAQRTTMQSSHELQLQVREAQDRVGLKKARLEQRGKVFGAIAVLVSGILGALGYLKDTAIGQWIRDHFSR